MNSYIGTKLINATPMTREVYNELRGWTVPADENPDDEGFLVEYVGGGKANHPDFKGYISWSPKDVFERSYQPTTNMTFGMAIEAMKFGQKVARSGWNGKGMFVYYVPQNTYTAQTQVAKSYFGEGAKVPYNSYFAIKNVNDTVSTWVPSINDCLADDWEIVL